MPEQTKALLDQILVELHAIRGELHSRPTRVEQTFRRRLSVSALVLLLAVSIQVQGLHIEQCSPGARSESALDYVGNVDLAEFDADELQRLLRRDVAPWCDMLVPISSHNPGDKMPTGNNFIGFGIYGTVAVSLVLWMYWPVWFRKDPDDPDTEPRGPS